ncbi:hypothetical protein LSCM1_08269 [Leishmania martiniquensis]|uniref:Uncharacterized protein n=1 Tax=Leishmania martiniquensis TaxID=1580590 RepID=A0A836KUT2_9TRYP|nr:hypothetical protein LSCM1_08269 [Leishmania martiniquensis]
MQSLTTSSVLSCSAPAVRTAAAAAATLPKDTGGHNAVGMHTPANEEGRGAAAMSAVTTAAPLTTSGGAETRGTVRSESIRFYQSASRDTVGGGRGSQQHLRPSAGELQVHPLPANTLHSPRRPPPSAPPASLDRASTIAAPPAFPRGPKGPPGRPRGVLKRRPKAPRQRSRSRSACSAAIGAMRRSFGKAAALQHQRRRLSKSPEASTESTPAHIPCTAATAIPNPSVRANATGPAPPVPHACSARTSAALEAFLLSFQNCLHRQEILLQRVDAAVAQLDGSRVNADTGAASSSPSHGAGVKAFSSLLPSANLFRSIDPLPQYVPSLHILPYALAAPANDGLPTQPNVAITLPGAVIEARSSGGAFRAATCDSCVDGTSLASPVLSVSSSLPEFTLADARQQARRHQPNQSSSSSAVSSTVVVMRPALERMGGSSGGAAALCASSQGYQSPHPQTSSHLLLPTYVRLDGAASAPASATPSRHSHPLTLFPSSKPGTPPLRAQSGAAQLPLLTSNSGCASSSPLSTRERSPASTSAALATCSPPVSFRGRGMSVAQQSSGVEAELTSDGLVTGAVTRSVSVATTDRREAAAPSSAASTAMETSAPGDAERSAGSRLKSSATTDSFTDVSASPSPVLQGVQMPYLTTTISGASQSFNYCGSAAIDGVPGWSNAPPGHTRSGSFRLGGNADSSVISAFTSGSADSVSLSPLSRPPSIWVGSPRARSAVGPISPHQPPQPSQQHSSLGGCSMNTTWMSPRRMPNSHNSRSSSNAAGTMQATASRSPRAGAVLEHSRPAFSAANPASSQPSTSQQQPHHRGSGDMLSPLSGPWLFSPSPTPTVSRRASGVVHRSSAQMTSVSLSGSGAPNIGGNTGGPTAVTSASAGEANVVSSLSSASLAPLFLSASGSGSTGGGASAGAAPAGTSPLTTCRRLALSPLASVEGADGDDPFQEASLRSLLDPTDEVNDGDETEAAQLRQLANRYAPPPPPPLLTELQQQQNQRRRWSAPPVPTMRRPPMAPLRLPNPAGSAAVRDEEERPRSATPPGARPEQWLLFEQQHERLHLPECWRDSEVVVVDHVEKRYRERDAEEAAQLLLLEEELLRELRQGASDQRDRSGLPRRGRRRGGGRWHSMVGAGATDETTGEEELNWGDDSEDETETDAAHETRLARYGKAMLLHRRGRAHASLSRGEGRSRSNSPSATVERRQRRSVSEAGGQGFSSAATAAATSSSMGEPSGTCSASPTAADAHADLPMPPKRALGRRHSAPAAMWGADNGAEWRDLQARFDELISIQQRSRGSGRDGADSAALEHHWPSSMISSGASTPVKEGLASGVPRRRRSRSSSQEVTACVSDTAGRDAERGAPLPSASERSDYCDGVPHHVEGSGSSAASLPHSPAASPMSLEWPYPHLSPRSHHRGEWKRKAQAEVAPSPLEEGGTAGQPNCAHVSAARKSPPTFLMSPRHPSVSMSAAHKIATKSSTKVRTDAGTYDTDGDESGRQVAVAVCAPAVSTALRTPRLRFAHPSRTASSMGLVGRPRRGVGLHSAAVKGRRDPRVSRKGRAAGKSKAAATPTAAGALSTPQKAAATTAASGRRGHTATLKSAGRGGSARVSSGAVSGGRRCTHCSRANSVSLDITAAAASIVPAREAEDKVPTTVTGLNSHNSTRADAETVLPGLHPSDHALDGGEVVEPLSRTLLVAAAAAPATVSPSPATQKSSRDSATQRGRLRDHRAHSSRCPDKDHDTHRVLLSSPPRHRCRRHTGAEGDASVSARPLPKASARHAPGLPESEARHLENGAAAGMTAAEGADSRALLRRLAQQKNRTRAMEERLRVSSSHTTSGNVVNGGHSARSLGGGFFVWGDGATAWRGGMESESCTPMRTVTRGGAAAELARQDLSTSSHIYAVPPASGDAAVDTPVARTGTTRHGGGTAADAPHVTVVGPAEAAAVYGVHGAPLGATTTAPASPLAPVSASAQLTSSNPRRRRVDLRTRLSPKLGALSSSMSARSARRNKGWTAAVATTAAAPASPQKFRRAESAYVRTRTGSPPHSSAARHGSHSDRRRHTIGSDVLTLTTPSTSARRPRSTRTPPASQLADWVREGV